MPDNPFEIPQSLREVSEHNLNQAHAAYEQFILNAAVGHRASPFLAAAQPNGVGLAVRLSP